MIAIFYENWNLLMLRGILALAFGIAALIWPAITLGVLVILFGMYAILEGIMTALTALKNRTENYWWLLFVEGISGVVIGLFALLWPSLTAVLLLVFIAAWAVFTGILEIAAAVQLRKSLKGEWVLALAGVFSILIGLFLAANPGTGAVAVVWIIGCYAILFGILLIFLGLKMRQYTR